MGGSSLVATPLTAGVASPTLPRHRLVAGGPWASASPARTAAPPSAQPPAAKVLVKSAGPPQASLAPVRVLAPASQPAASPVSSPVMLSGGVGASIAKPAWLQAPALSPAGTGSVVVNMPCAPGRTAASTVVPNFSRWCGASTAIVAWNTGDVCAFG